MCHSLSLSLSHIERVYTFISQVVFRICASSDRFAFILKLHHVCMQNIAIMHLLLCVCSTLFFHIFSQNVSVLRTCRNFNTNFTFKELIVSKGQPEATMWRCGVWSNLTICRYDFPAPKTRRRQQEKPCQEARENWNTSLRPERMHVCQGTGTTTQ